MMPLLTMVPAPVLTRKIACVPPVTLPAVPTVIVRGPVVAEMIPDPVVPVVTVFPVAAAPVVTGRTVVDRSRCVVRGIPRGCGCRAEAVAAPDHVDAEPDLRLGSVIPGLAIPGSVVRSIVRPVVLVVVCPGGGAGEHCQQCNGTQKFPLRHIQQPRLVATIEHY